MSTVSLILAADEQGGMGLNNALPWHLPADFAHFKKYTIGKPIIMGRKTYQSIGRPLPGRLNIVLSRSAREITGVEVVSSLDAAFSLAQNAPEVMVIGGVDIFKAALDRAERVYLTRVHHVFEADVFFPELDSSIWHKVLLEDYAADDKNAHAMSFYCYSKAA
ncbi:MAG: dihydrofolate reductase [Gammaproteobacteria bacterium]|nr:dihydrofolate reductase [Gammaproteobacteria bacterium]MCH9764316.1 dihydrofolate reductase [Gammaproteobacteria bacterium]